MQRSFGSWIGRAFVVMSALALAACPDPAPPKRTEPSPTTQSAPPSATPAVSAPMAASVSASASTLPDEPLPPTNEDVFSLKRADAGAAGVGFQVSGLANQSWTRIASPRTLLQLSGPPGGPLGFEVRGYGEDAEVTDLAKTFAGFNERGPVTPGAEEKVELGGRAYEARAFGTGASLAATTWCLIRVPAKAGAKTGLLVLAHAGARHGAPPSCKDALQAPAIVPLVKSFRLND